MTEKKKKDIPIDSILLEEFQRIAKEIKDGTHVSSQRVKMGNSDGEDFVERANKNRKNLAEGKDPLSERHGKGIPLEELKRIFKEREEAIRNGTYVPPKMPTITPTGNDFVGRANRQAEQLLKQLKQYEYEVQYSSSRIDADTKVKLIIMAMCGLMYLGLAYISTL